MMKKTKPGCPGQEDFLRIFLHEAGLDEKEAMVDHLLHCGRCRKTFSILARIGSGLQKIEGNHPGPLTAEESRRLGKILRREARWGSWKAFPGRLRPSIVIASAALLLSIAGGVFLLIRNADTDGPRGESAKLRLLEPVGRIHNAPSLFRWTPIAGTDHYEWNVYDDKLRDILTRETTETSLILETEEKALIKPGETYIWTVESISPNEQEIATGRESFIWE